MARLLAVFLLSALSQVMAECPNACSAHGKCTAYDSCVCYRNWMSNDCSERVCQFGIAHVDSPKGDLDASGPTSTGAFLSGPDVTVVENNFIYPYGTTEQFPNMVNSKGVELKNTAHYYMECSNKGLCDRASGSCECFPGYEGSACQRASCPSGDGGVCSGHGTCNTIREIADLDHGNIYELWDKHASMGCVCDAGYSGPSCAEKQCKYGIDPLYVDDDFASPRISNWTVSIFHKAGTVAVTGTYSLIFYDAFGEDWETDPIKSDAYCDEIITALESLPNKVIPENSVLCLSNDNRVGYGQTTTTAGQPNPASFIDQISSGTNFQIHRNFILAFPGNPGKLKPLEVNFYLDGRRPTLQTDETTYSLQSYVYADGFHGEFVDNVPDLCEDVLVTLTVAPYNNVNFFRLNGLDQREIQRLKRCLGDADGITEQSSYEPGEVYQWDFGNQYFPHLIKLVDQAPHNMVRLCNSTRTYNAIKNAPGWCEYEKPAGIYVPLFYKRAANGEDIFWLYGTKGMLAYTTGAVFSVFTTTGYLETVNGFGSYQQTSSHERDEAPHMRNGLYMKALDYKDSGHIHWYGPNLDLSTVSDMHGNYSLTIDCENWAEGRTSFYEKVGTCIQKGDEIMMWDMTIHQDDQSLAKAPLFHNMYTVEKIFIDRDESYTKAVNINNQIEIVSDYIKWTSQGTIIFDKRPNFYYDLGLSTNPHLLAWKFRWPKKSKPLEYVSQCSGRGLCNTDSGICECFTGHTGDDCSLQNTLAK